MEYYYTGTESLWCGNWNHLVCRRWKWEVDHPSQSTVVNLGKKQKLCSLWCLEMRWKMQIYRCKISCKRQRQTFIYSHGQKKICETALTFLHDIGNRAFKNLKKQIGLNRERRKTSPKCTSVSSNWKRSNVHKFADENAAPRGRNEITPIYLPAYETKTLCRILWRVATCWIEFVQKYMAI